MIVTSVTSGYPMARPRTALVVFESPAGTFLTAHDVTEGEGGRPVIGAGKLIGPQGQRDLADILRGGNGSGRRFLPANVLVADPDCLAWVAEPAVRDLYFRAGKGRPFKVRAPYPRLVCRVRDRSFAVAAIKARGRPEPDTPLYHAPLMNIFGGGGLCVGNAALPNGEGVEHMEGWERVLFDTAYSHVNHPRTLRLEGQREVDNVAHVAFWRGLKGATRFPNRHLQPMNLTLGDWLA